MGQEVISGLKTGDGVFGGILLKFCGMHVIFLPTITCSA